MPPWSRDTPGSIGITLPETLGTRGAWSQLYVFAALRLQAIKPDRYVRKQACVVWKAPVRSMNRRANEMLEDLCPGVRQMA